MAELAAVIQTSDAAFHIAALAGRIVQYIIRCVRARQRAKKLLEDVYQLEVVARRIGVMLKDRGDTRTSDLEERLNIGLMRYSLWKCQTSLQNLEMKLQMVVQNAPKRSVPRAFGLMKVTLDENFLKEQYLEIRAQFGQISLVFHILDRIDRHHDREDQQEYQRQHFAVLNEQEDLLRRILEIVSSAYPEEASTVLLRRSTTSSSGSASSRVRSVHTNASTEQSPIGRLEDIDEEEDEPEFPQLEPSEQVPQETVRQISTNTLELTVKYNESSRTRSLLDEFSQSDEIDAIRVHDGNNLTLLHHAVCRDAPESLEVLLDNVHIIVPEYLDTKTVYGSTALMEAARRCDREAGLKCGQLLLQKGADVNIADEEGRTALILAIMRPCTDYSDAFVQLLVIAGADVRVAMDRAHERLVNYTWLLHHINQKYPSDSGSNSVKSQETSTRPDRWKVVGYAIRERLRRAPEAVKPRSPSIELSTINYDSTH